MSSTNSGVREVSNLGPTPGQALEASVDTLATAFRDLGRRKDQKQAQNLSMLRSMANTLEQPLSKTMTVEEADQKLTFIDEMRDLSDNEFSEKQLDIMKDHFGRQRVHAVERQTIKDEYMAVQKQYNEMEDKGEFGDPDKIWKQYMATLDDHAFLPSKEIETMQSMVMEQYAEAQVKDLYWRLFDENYMAESDDGSFKVRTDISDAEKEFAYDTWNLIESRDYKGALSNLRSLTTSKYSSSETRLKEINDNIAKSIKSQQGDTLGAYGTMGKNADSYLANEVLAAQEEGVKIGVVAVDVGDTSLTQGKVGADRIDEWQSSLVGNMLGLLGHQEQIGNVAQKVYKRIFNADGDTTQLADLSLQKMVDVLNSTDVPELTKMLDFNKGKLSSIFKHDYGTQVSGVHSALKKYAEMWQYLENNRDLLTKSADDPLIKWDAKDLKSDQGTSNAKWDTMFGAPVGGAGGGGSPSTTSALYDKGLGQQGRPLSDRLATEVNDSLGINQKATSVDIGYFQVNDVAFNNMLTEQGIDIYDEDSFTPEIQLETAIDIIKNRQEGVGHATKGDWNDNNAWNNFDAYTDNSYKAFMKLDDDALRHKGADPYMIDLINQNNVLNDKEKTQLKAVMMGESHGKKNAVNVNVADKNEADLKRDEALKKVKPIQTIAEEMAKIILEEGFLDDKGLQIAEQDYLMDSINSPYDRQLIMSMAKKIVLEQLAPDPVNNLETEIDEIVPTLANRRQYPIQISPKQAGAGVIQGARMGYNALNDAGNVIKNPAMAIGKTLYNNRDALSPVFEGLGDDLNYLLFKTLGLDAQALKGNK
ncbi:hypothetical protein ACFL4H_00330 [Candidatus Neomarinimicrobiota bacterium]